MTPKEMRNFNQFVSERGLRPLGANSRTLLLGRQTDNGLAVYRHLYQRDGFLHVEHYRIDTPEVMLKGCRSEFLPFEDGLPNGGLYPEACDPGIVFLLAERGCTLRFLPFDDREYERDADGIIVNPEPVSPLTFQLIA